MCKWRKAIPGLLVLLAWPCLGSGGRAEAGFAPAPSALAPDHSPGTPGFELRLILNTDTATHPATSSSPGMGEEADPPAPTDVPLKHHPFCQALLLPTASQSSGCSSSSSPIPGGGLGTGALALPTLNVAEPECERSTRLFLADERLKPPPFSTRLFRPPRIPTEQASRN